MGDGRIRIHSGRATRPAAGPGPTFAGTAGFIVRALRQVTRSIPASAFDVVEAHNMPDALVLRRAVPKLRGTPVILNVHDTFPELFATKFDRSVRTPGGAAPTSGGVRQRGVTDASSR